MPLSSKRLEYLISDGHNTNDRQYCIDSVNQYLTCHCSHPQKVNIVDQHTGELRTIYVSCGKCYHCKETKINSWVTRMYAHCEDFKNVYFVTLTYRSYSKDMHPIERLSLNKLGDAAFVYDTNNETNRPCYSPSLLIKKHYQNFIKRLRKNTGYNDITYCLSGEYGKKYGRPHFHMILFTNNILTPYDIKKAWSIAVFRDRFNHWSYKTNQKNGTSYYFPIGRTDFHDLVRNGSFNTDSKVKIDGRAFDSSNCFAYVVKYVCKQDKYNKSRIIGAYNQMYKHVKLTHLINESIDPSSVSTHLRELGIKYDINSLNNLLKKHSYEKFEPYHGCNLYPFNFVRHKLLEIPVSLETMFVEKTFYPENLSDFIESFKPFVEFSRSTAIGSLYAKRHVQEFTQGVFNPPALQCTSFVVPNYFRTKAKEYVYGLRRTRKTIKSTSFVLSNLPYLHRFITESLENIPLRYMYSCPCPTEENVSSLLQSHLSWLDKYTGVHYLFPAYNGVVFVQGYKYDRAQKKYIQCFESDYVTFFSEYLERLNKEFSTYSCILRESKEQFAALERATCMLRDFGLELSDLAIEYEKMQADYLHHRNIEYDSVHASAE